MKFKITSKIFVVYLWFISIVVLGVSVLSTFMLYSIGYELNLLSIIFMATPFVLAVSIILCLVLAKGPIKIFLYIFGSLLMAGGGNEIVHQYLMQTSGSLEMLLIEYLVGVSTLFFGLCIVAPAHWVIRLEENV